MTLPAAERFPVRRPALSSSGYRPPRGASLLVSTAIVTIQLQIAIVRRQQQCLQNLDDNLCAESFCKYHEPLDSSPMVVIQSISDDHSVNLIQPSFLSIPWTKEERRGDEKLKVRCICGTVSPGWLCEKLQRLDSLPHFAFIFNRNLLDVQSTLYPENMTHFNSQ